MTAKKMKTRYVETFRGTEEWVGILEHEGRIVIDDDPPPSHHDDYEAILGAARVSDNEEVRVRAVASHSLADVTLAAGDLAVFGGVDTRADDEIPADERHQSWVVFVRSL